MHDILSFFRIYSANLILKSIHSSSTKNCFELMEVLPLIMQLFIVHRTNMVQPASLSLKKFFNYFLVHLSARFEVQMHGIHHWNPGIPLRSYELDTKRFELLSRKPNTVDRIG